MKRSVIRGLLVGTAVAAVLAATPAGATEYRAVLADTYNGDTDRLISELGRVFAEKVGPGDTFSLWDGTNNKRVAKIAVPDDKRYSVVKRKMRKFAREIAKIASFLKGLTPGGAPAPGRLDTLSVMRGVGDNRTGSDDDIHVLLIGNPLQVTHDPVWSMIGEDGQLQMPTDAALLSPSYRTPYSVKGRDGLLDKTFIHMCTAGGAKSSPLQDMALRHVWGQWTAAQGGALATWADDISVCVERFGARVATPIKIAAPDKSLPPAMVRPVWNASDRDENGGTVQPDVFNVFFKANHERVQGLIVYTGVEYRPDRYPARYNSAWCYFNSAAGRDGVQVRIAVGDKVFGKAPAWSTPSKRELKAAGITREDFELARAVCRFPAEDG